MIKLSLPDKSLLPRRIFSTGMPFIILTLLYIAYTAASNDLSSGLEYLTVRRSCMLMLEHALMSAALLIAGCAASEMIGRE